MIIEIGRIPDDDPEFTSAICSLVATLSRETALSEVFTIRIDNWFDHKWLRYSGMGRVKFYQSEFLLSRSTALDPLTQHHLTFPPFSPSRVIEQRYWRRGDADSPIPETTERMVHASRGQE